MDVRRLRADEWERWREFRLAMLKEAPYAFGTTYAEASAFSDEQWRDRVDRLARSGDSILYVADDGGDWLGCAGGYTDEDTGLPNVFGVWTRPDARGRRIAETLVRTVVAWAKDKGHTEVRLWATDGNDAARRVYDRLGFLPNGATQPLPSDESKTESEYALTI
jgi:GNAT superfamily N-acetyltransferase